MGEVIAAERKFLKALLSIDTGAHLPSVYVHQLMKKTNGWASSRKTCKSHEHGWDEEGNGSGEGVCYSI
jgi:hypothetical protein